MLCFSSMFDMKVVNISSNLLTVRTVSGAEGLSQWLMIACAGKEEKAVECAEQDFCIFERASSSSGSFTVKMLRGIYNDIHSDIDEAVSNPQKNKRISNNMQYWSHYLAHKLCLLMQKALCIINNKDLHGILARVNKEYSELYFDTKYWNIVYDINSIKKEFESIKKLDLRYAFDIFSRFREYRFQISAGNASIFPEKVGMSIDNDKAFSIIKECILQYDGLSSSVFGLSSSIADICRLKEVQQDDGVMSKLYPIYKEMKRFLTEDQKVDLSYYEEKVARKEAQAREKEEIKDRLFENTLKLAGDMSRFIIRTTDQSRISSEDVHKLTDSMDKLTDSMDKLTEQLAKTCKNDIPTGINNIIFHNAIEGQEPQVEVQVMATD